MMRIIEILGGLPLIFFVISSPWFRSERISPVRIDRSGRMLTLGASCAAKP